MTKHHPYRLRPYHNPERVDGSKVPSGWRFRYSDEMRMSATGPCAAWLDSLQIFDDLLDYQGICEEITYIVPVTP